jgi:Cu/Ag efflux protein CusF
VKKLLVLAIVAAFAAFAWLSLPTLEQEADPRAPRQTASGSGLILAIDRDKGVVTISHGAMPALGMPPMIAFDYR